MPRSRDEWNGSVKVHRGILHLQVKDGVDGDWVERSLKLPDTPANRKIAEKKLRDLREAILGRLGALGTIGPATVRAWAKKWFEDRERTGLTRIAEDRAKFERHVCQVRGEGWSLPIGDMPLEDVHPRHMVEVVKRMQDAVEDDGVTKKYAPRTWRNVYYTARALFRDAEVEELIPRNTSPCNLTKRQLGKMRDKTPGWRESAIYTRHELHGLVFDDEVIPLVRRVMYALLGVAMLRDGELAGLRFRRMQFDAEPLGRLSIMTSYDDGSTKTEIERFMPIHPSIAPLLAEWKLSGWAQTFGRSPTPDDLVVPVPPAGAREGAIVRKLAIAAFRAKLLAARDRASLTNREVDKALGTKGMAAHWFDSQQASLPKAAVWPALAKLLRLEEDLGQEFAQVRAMPVNKATRSKPAGSMLDRHWVWKRLRKDLIALGYRHRRAHDLRRTGISLSRTDGAQKDILRRGTHAPPKDIIELYTEYDYDVLCREVAKLRLNGKRDADVLELESGGAGGAPAEDRGLAAPENAPTPLKHGKRSVVDA